MKIWFTALVLAMMAVIAFVAFRTRQRKETVWHLLREMMLVILLMDVCYLLAVFFPAEAGVLFFEGAYHTGYLLLLFAFLQFVYGYAENKQLYPLFRRFVRIVAVVDFLSLTVLNVIFRHAITYSDFTWKDGYLYHAFHLTTANYMAHMIFTASLAVVALLLIIYRFFHTDSIYRRRYGMLFLLFTGMVGLYAIIVSLETPLDLILIGFNVLALALSYSVGRLIPRDLLIRIMTYASYSLEEGVACFDNRNRLLYTNLKAREFLRICGAGDDAEAYFLHLMQEKGLEGQTSRPWNEKVTEGENELYFDCHYRSLYDEDAVFIGSYITMLDRSAEHRILETETMRATHDPLTGLYNADGFMKRAGEILQEDPDTPRYMLTSNIKDFKLVNDLFGMEKGNDVLTGIADRIRHVRSEQTVSGRLTGDHFVMLINKDRFRESLFMEGIAAVGEMIHATSYMLCLHVGVFEIDDPGMSVSLMIDRANMAIATIKNENRSMIAYFDQQMMQDSLNERRIVSELQPAIDAEDITVYLQPQVDADGTVIGAEALARWIHPKEGLLMPARFISVLENAGLIYKLDLAVWEKACKLLRDWKGTPLEHLYLSVNISARDFYYIDLYSSITNLADRYDIDPKKLHLEITESAMIAGFEKQLDLVGRLRSYGFEVELDDFGSGYSSLSMLKDLPVDTLKLDLMFLKETENKMRARVILASVVSLAGLLGMKVIAEGVESKGQLDYLKTLGCTRFQGYFFSRPIPVVEFEENLSASRA